MRASIRPCHLLVTCAVAVSLTLAQAPASAAAPGTSTDAGVVPPSSEVATAAMSTLLADSATDAAPAVPGEISADGSTLPADAEAGVESTLATGAETTIHLPADGEGEVVGSGSVAYEGEHPDASLVVDRVDASEMPQVASSTRTQVVIGDSDAPTRYRFGLDLPPGVRLTVRSSGAVHAVNGAGRVVGMFAPPWALDAAGDRVPTRLEVRGSDLVQVVDHRSAVHPVVADPWWFVPLVVAGRAVTHKLAVRAASATAARQAAVRAATRQGYTVRSVGTAVRGNFFTAAGHVIRVNGAFTRANGYRSFRAFKRAHGTKKDHEWHHIVETRNVGRFKAWQIHNKQNLVLIRTGLHRRCVSAMMSTKLKNMTKAELRALNIKRVPANRNLTLRENLDGFSLSNMHLYGLRLLVFCGVKITDVP